MATTKPLIAPGEPQGHARLYPCLVHGLQELAVIGYSCTPTSIHGGESRLPTAQILHLLRYPRGKDVDMKVDLHAFIISPWRQSVTVALRQRPYV
jgi:hypothetical protein